MAIQTLWDTGTSYPITPGMDGGVYGTGISDAVCGGIGDEFTINYTSDSLTVQFNAGSQAVIGGAFFRVMSLEALTLAANSTIYLCANINKSNANGSRGSFVQRTSSNMQNGNLNGSGSQRDLLLYVITTGANGVTNVTDRRIIRTGGNITVVPSHTHGNISNNGDITSTSQIASGDRLVINDESASRITNSSITFGSNSSQYLANNGTWQSVPSSFNGVDSSRILLNVNTGYTSTPAVTWTATENAWIVVDDAPAYTGLYIDGVMVWGALDGSWVVARLVPLKKGQSMMIGGASEHYRVVLKIYGAK